MLDVYILHFLDLRIDNPTLEACILHTLELETDLQEGNSKMSVPEECTLQTLEHRTDVQDGETDKSPI